MLQLSFFYHFNWESGHYYDLFELGHVMKLEQTWSAFDQGLISKNVYQLCELANERKLILILL